jgi:hypothetical protein
LFASQSAHQFICQYCTATPVVLVAASPIDEGGGSKIYRLNRTYVTAYLTDFTSRIIGSDELPMSFFNQLNLVGQSMCGLEHA